MASEAQVPEISSLFERLLRQRDFSVFLPFLLGFSNTIIPREMPQDPDQETPETATTTGTPSRDRIILINPLTQGMVVIEGTSSLESLLRGLINNNKDGQPPASKASVEAMPRVEIADGDQDGDCVICLEDWEVGEVAREMPCKHRFHAKCIEEWLGIHGSCPVCRYKMPVDEVEVGRKRDEESRGEREIWVSFSFSGSGRRSGDSDQNEAPSSDPSDDSSSSPRPDHQTEG